MLILLVGAASSQAISSQDANQGKSNSSPVTAKQTLTPISFATMIMPTATASVRPIAEYLKSTGMIILFCGVGLLLVLLAIVAIIWKRSRIAYPQEISDGLVVSLVDDANLPTEGTIQL
jgi:hypothetical protein